MRQKLNYLMCNINKCVSLLELFRDPTLDRILVSWSLAWDQLASFWVVNPASLLYISYIDAPNIGIIHHFSRLIYCCILLGDTKRIMPTWTRAEQNLITLMRFGKHGNVHSSPDTDRIRETEFQDILDHN
jgi:hypothetical protein